MLGAFTRVQHRVFNSNFLFDDTERFGDFIERLARDYEILGHRGSVWLRSGHNACDLLGSGCARVNAIPVEQGYEVAISWNTPWVAILIVKSKSRSPRLLQ